MFALHVKVRRLLDFFNEVRALGAKSFQQNRWTYFYYSFGNTNREKNEANLQKKKSSVYIKTLNWVSKTFITTNNISVVFSSNVWANLTEKYVENRRETLGSNSFRTKICVLVLSVLSSLCQNLYPMSVIHLRLS